jgi:hypothetical protein
MYKKNSCSSILTQQEENERKIFEYLTTHSLLLQGKYHR